MPQSGSSASLLHLRPFLDPCIKALLEEEPRILILEPVGIHDMYLRDVRAAIFEARGLRGTHIIVGYEKCQDLLDFQNAHIPADADAPPTAELWQHSQQARHVEKASESERKRC